MRETEGGQIPFLRICKSRKQNIISGNTLKKTLSGAMDLNYKTPLLSEKETIGAM